MRIMLGLSEPTGAATIDGQRYADLQHPLRTVGAVLDQGFTRTARLGTTCASSRCRPGCRLRVPITCLPSSGSVT